MSGRTIPLIVGLVWIILTGRIATAPSGGDGVAGATANSEANAFTPSRFHEKGMPFFCDVERIQPVDDDGYFERMKKKFGDKFQERFTAAVKAGNEAWDQVDGEVKTKIAENIKSNKSPMESTDITKVPTLCLLQADLGTTLPSDTVKSLIARYDYGLAIKAMKALQSSDHTAFADEMKTMCKSGSGVPSHILKALLTTAMTESSLNALKVKLHSMYDDAAGTNKLSCKCLTMAMAVEQRAGVAAHSVGVKRLDKSCYDESRLEDRSVLIDAVVKSLESPLIGSSNWAEKSWLLPHLKDSQCDKIDLNYVISNKKQLKQVLFEAPGCPSVCGFGEKENFRRAEGAQMQKSPCSEKILKKLTAPNGLSKADIGDIGGLSGFLKFQVLKEALNRDSEPLKVREVCDAKKHGFCGSKRLDVIFRKRFPSDTFSSSSASDWKCAIPVLSNNEFETQKLNLCKEETRTAVATAFTEESVNLCQVNRYLSKCSSIDFSSLDLEKLAKIGVPAAAFYAKSVDLKVLWDDNGKAKEILNDDEAVKLLDMVPYHAPAVLDKLTLTAEADREAALKSKPVMRLIHSLGDFLLNDDLNSLDTLSLAQKVQLMKKVDEFPKVSMSKFKEQQRFIAAGITRTGLKDLITIPRDVLISLLCQEPLLSPSVRSYLMTEVLEKYLSSRNPANPWKAVTPGFIDSLDSKCLSYISLKMCKNYDASSDSDESLKKTCEFLCKNRANKDCLSPAYLTYSARVCKPFFQSQNSWTVDELKEFPAILLAHLPHADLDAILSIKNSFDVAHKKICMQPLMKASVSSAIITHAKTHLGNVESWSGNQLENLKFCLTSITETDATLLNLDNVMDTIELVSAALPEKRSLDGKCYFGQLPKADLDQYKNMKKVFLENVGITLFKRFKNNDASAETSAVKRNAVQFTCDDLDQMTADQRLALTVDEIDVISFEEVNSCRQTLGSTHGWSNSQATKLYEKLKVAKPICPPGTGSAASHDEVVQLGSLLEVMPNDDIDCLTVDDYLLPKVNSIVKWTHTQAEALLAQVQSDFSTLTYNPPTAANVNALGNIMCAVPDSNIQAMDDDEFKKALGVLSELDHCPIEFYASVVKKSKSAVAAVSSWDSTTMMMIGTAAAGLSGEDVTTLSATEGVLDGLSPQAAAIMPGEVLNAMPVSIISTLPESILCSLSEDQLSKLDHDKRSAADFASKGIADDTEQTSVAAHVHYNFMLLISVLGVFLIGVW